VPPNPGRVISQKTRSPTSNNAYLPGIDPKPAELNKTTRQQRDEVPRHRLHQLVQAAAGTARDEQDFLHRLRAGGLLVRPRSNTTDPSQLAGYAVALPDDRNAAGDTIWCSGSTLAHDLSLPNLRRGWPPP
jgi:hypothetical protein